MINETNPDLVPQATFTRVLGLLARGQVSMWILRGKIPTYKVHGENWVRISDGRALLKSRKDK